MYFLSGMDRILKDEINSINSENFYLSGVMIQKKMVILIFLTVEKIITVLMKKTFK